MNKLLITLLIFIVLIDRLSAGGLLTNTNQSAQYMRMLSRNSSTEIDAVYFNPAGLMKLDYGWHYSISNISTNGKKTIRSDYPYLSQELYTGDFSNLISPSLHLAYRSDDWIFSLWSGQIVSDGKSAFSRGIPSQQINISKIKLMPDLKIDDYRAKIVFESNTILWGLQAGATYRLSDEFTIYGGIRFVTGSNKYNGFINNLEAKIDGNYVPASPYFNELGIKYTQNAAVANSQVLNLDDEIREKGVGNLSLQNLVQAGVYSNVWMDELFENLNKLGSNPVDGSWTVSQVRNEFSRLAREMDGTGKSYLTKSNEYADKNIDILQSGYGITPIIGLCLTPSEDLVLSMKYEYRTGIRFANQLNSDDLNLFNDKETERMDLPPLFSVGLGYKPFWWLETQFSYNIFFDKEAGWGYNLREKIHNRKTTRDINSNMYEIGFGMQINLTDRFAISTGGLLSNSDVADSYQSDFSYSNPSYTLAAGFQWKITDQLAFDAGFMNVFYKDAEVTYTDPDLTVNSGKYNEVFGKTLMGFGFGLSYSIFR